MLNDIAEDQKTREKERGRYIERKKETQRQQAKMGGGVKKGANNLFHSKLLGPNEGQYLDVICQR